MRNPLRILSIEDDPKDSKLIQDLLETEDIVCEVTRVDTEPALLACLEQGGIDLILADYSLPSFDGISALKFAMKACPEVPFIFVSGTLGEEVAIEALKIGATDYVLKTRLSRLVPSVQRALREASERAEHKEADEKLRRSEAYLTEAQRLSQTGSFGCTPSTGEMFWSEETFRIYGYDRSTQPTVERVLQRVHPEDKPFVQEQIDRATREGKDCHVECRLLLPDDSVKHVRIVAHASKNEPGIIQFIGAVMDVTATKQANEKLRQSEAYLAEAQKVSHTGSFGWNVLSGEIHWSRETFRIFEYEPTAKVTIAQIVQRTHPEDRSAVQQLIERVSRERTDFDFEHRLLTPDGSVKYLRVIGSPSEKEDGCFEFVGAVTDITERKRGEEALRRSEAYLAEAQKATHTGSWALDGTTRAALYWSEEMFRIFGFDPQQGLPMRDQWLQRIHPEDRDTVKRQASDRMFLQKVDSDVEYRIVLPDGTVKHIHGLAHPVFNSNRELVEVVGTAIDVTERKRAEEKIRQSEMQLRQILDFTPQLVAVVGPDQSRIYTNKAALDYFGLTLEQWQGSSAPRFLHPDDLERVMREIQSKFLSGSPFETEARFSRKDGKYRWFLLRFNPVRDEQGRVIRWYLAATDIEDRRQAEQRLRDENVALREEIDRASMFEEIVGISPALHAVLSRVSKVAPTDSTVLITGETGTGKELVARAIHRRSHRSSRAFVSVNCAAVPRDLIASELFGHEKGAFTGATQRRLGRFELAEGGTIFLDEVGELPAETQIALLRVLQEHEFGRVGGAGSIRTNVRVIAATNRDLEAAITAGTFRSDLFYRLNVFPIEVPPLRERQEDIPVLVEYFIDRYASKAGKSIRGVNKKSLELLQSYPWPGNIRELQNVIERSVIVCDTENFSVDASWLSRQPLASDPKTQLELARKPAAKEKEIIQAALSESGGRVYGPSGAAAKLGMPRSTLESKIRSLKIDKNLFKTAAASKNS
jgi:PAS domain S-box-containing protein